MINLIMTKINVKIKKLFFNRKLITIHFGKNPMNGGNPPNERKLIISDILIMLFKLTINNWLIK